MHLPRSIFENSRVLIIDDDERSALLLQRMLQGHFQVHILTDERETFTTFRRLRPDILLLDIFMPHISGFEILQTLREDYLALDDYYPVLVLTGDENPQTKLRALTAGAKDFLHKPLDPAEVVARIRNLLETRFLHLEMKSHNHFLEERVQERTTQLEATLANLRTTQAQVIKQERLAALGVMATGIAHDFNNTLSSILGYGELLLEAPERTEYVERILNAGHDARQIVRRLREFSKPGDPAAPLAAVSLHTLIDQAVSLTMPRWSGQALATGAHITVKRQYSELPPVAGHPAELRELFTNLIFNAVDALPRGGQIVIRAYCEGDTAVVQLSDNGLGMSPDTVRRCMEPFFTTKGEEGTGLGLSVVHGIVKRHKAAIHIQSQLQVGTTITLRFPIAVESDTPEPLPAAPVLERPLKILFVDDQPIIGEMVAQLLLTDGHAVDVATSASIALEKCRMVNYDLVITDLAMPRTNGEQLAALIRELHPGKPVICLTGFPDLVTTADHVGPDPLPIDLVLPKPAGLEDLRRAIFQVFTRTQSVAGPFAPSASPTPYPVASTEVRRPSSPAG